MSPPGAAEHGFPPTAASHLAVLPGGKDCDLQGAVGDGAVDRPTLSRRTRAPMIIAFAVAGAALVAWLVTSQPGAAGLRALPADQRAALAERTLANLREVCQGPGRPREFCRDQAQLVLQLPECTGPCRTQARSELMADTAVK